LQARQNQKNAKLVKSQKLRIKRLKLFRSKHNAKLQLAAYFKRKLFRLQAKEQ
jgi:hypothetical protein